MIQSKAELNSLDDWLAYISKTHPSEIEMGLDRIRAVYEQMKSTNLNSTRQAKQVVVVSGTNGKGSTIALIESGLLALGYSVGTYTSPHIRRYNERVKINAESVSDAMMIGAFENVERARISTPLTYFEFGTLAALDILFNAELDVILLEIGLGGRLDAVNIVDADLSIITSVGLDHTDWLGDSLEQIGLEKAGILRANSQAILGENLPKTVRQYAANIECEVVTVRHDIDRNAHGVNLVENGCSLEFKGFPVVRLPENNILIAFQALKNLINRMDNNDESTFNYSSLVTCFSNIKVEGRFEQIKSKKLRLNQQVFLDVGHNPHAAHYLLKELSALKSADVVVNVVYSSLADKDASALVEILAPQVDTWYLAPLNVERALDIAELQTAVGEYAKNMLSFASLHDAFQSALFGKVDASGLEKKSITLIFGSFYVIDAAKAYFEGL